MWCFGAIPGCFWGHVGVGAGGDVMVPMTMVVMTVMTMMTTMTMVTMMSMTI